MSLIIPAFNEEDRLMGMLEEAVTYLENEYGTYTKKANTSTNANETLTHRHPHPNNESNNHLANPLRGWEILLIDDGSTDSTISTALNFARTHQHPHQQPPRHPGPWTANHTHHPTVTIPPSSIRLISSSPTAAKAAP